MGFLRLLEQCERDKERDERERDTSCSSIVFGTWSDQARGLSARDPVQDQKGEGGGVSRG